MRSFLLSPAFKQQAPRLVTGLLLGFVLLACMLLGGLYLRCAAALVSTLALFEFFQMFWPGKSHLPTKAFGLCLGLGVFCPADSTAGIQVVLVLSLFWAALAFLFDYGRGNEGARLEQHAALPLGILYIPVVLNMALALSLKEQFLVVLAAVASDTAAYYAGTAFGSKKIWPRVSPKKSWQGCCAGFALSVCVSLAIACLPYGNGPLLGGNPLLWLGIAALLNITAQLGDFFESALKRTCGVKDSSSILPGHGGILDRIDSILFSLGTYSAILFIIGKLTA